MKDQRLTFIISKTSSGQMKVQMDFYPKLAKDKEAFELMPMERREMQNAAADIGRYAMERLASARGVTEDGKSYMEKK